MNGTRPMVQQYREMGYSAAKIAEMVGVSRVRVYQIWNDLSTPYFKRIDPKLCVYPKIAEWINENQIPKCDLIRRLGWELCDTAYSRIRRIMRGQQELRKSDIDRFIRATGMKYEELFAEEESNG